MPLRIGLLALLALSLLVSCSKKEDGGDVGGAGDKAVEPDHSYKSRGIVRAVTLDKDETTLSIHHEAFPEWVNRSGQKVPMMSMTMEFVAAPSLDLGGVAVGDKIAFALDVYYADTPRLEITSIEKLPADTELEISGH